MSLPEDLHSARAIRLGEQEALTAFSRTDRTVPDHGVYSAPGRTLRVYAHVISDQLSEAADIFARTVAATN